MRGGVLPQFLPVDVTDVEAESEALAGCLLYFCDYGDLSKADAEVMVKRHGGRVSRGGERLGGEGWREREMCLWRLFWACVPTPQVPKDMKFKNCIRKHILRAGLLPRMPKHEYNAMVSLASHPLCLNASHTPG